MKSVCLFLSCLFFSVLTFGQNITGKWTGVLDVGGVKLKVVFNVSKGDQGYQATMDSPDQGVNGIPVTKTTFEPPKINFEISNVGIEYNGEIKEEKIYGFFKQSGQQFPLDLKKEMLPKNVLITSKNRDYHLQVEVQL